MALVIADRVKETSTTAGTGTVVLAGASPGYQSFAVIGNTNTTFYTIADQGGGTNWEVGIGTYYSGNLSLARTTILASSNSNTAVSFGSNTKDVFVTYPAEYAVYNNTASVTTIQNLASGNVAFTGGSINNVLIGNATANTAVFTELTASSNITTTGYTGYLYGNNSAVVTASTTIPSSAITGLGTMASQNANAVNITGGTIAGTGITSSNVTITGGTINTVTETSGTYNNVTVNGGTINGVTLSNITYGGLGTMSTQNANNVTITGGTLNNVIIGGSTAANGSFTNLTLTNQLIANASSGVSGQVLTSAGANVSPYWANAATSGISGLSNNSIVALNVNLTANATINAGVNGFSVGPVNTANGVTITITSGQRWVII